MNGVLNYHRNRTIKRHNSSSVSSKKIFIIENIERKWVEKDEKRKIGKNLGIICQGLVIVAMTDSGEDGESKLG